jgi:hypothetical protein
LVFFSPRQSLLQIRKSGNPKIRKSLPHTSYNVPKIANNSEEQKFSFGYTEIEQLSKWLLTA